jgi:hypothetical protein
MASPLALRLVSTSASVYYFASGVLISLSVSAFFASFGTVPAPPNFWWLIASGLCSGVSSYFLWSLAGAIDRLRSYTAELRGREGVHESDLMNDAVQEYGSSIKVRVLGSTVLAALALIVLILGQVA